MSVPVELGRLAALKSLALNANQLTSVPAQFGQLKALTYLGLTNNPGLGALPDAVILLQKEYGGICTISR